MEDETTRGMSSSLYSHVRRDSIKLVHRPGIAQGNYILDNITTKFYSHFIV
jgi:hypothetical protein